jgi:hypothetical protein
MIENHHHHRNAPRRWSRRVALAVIVTVGVTIASTPPAAAAEDPVDRLATAVVTPDGEDRYQLRSNGSTLTVAAPGTNRDSNLRVVGGARNAAFAVDQRSCLTWEGPPNGTTQPGLALRIRNRSGGTQAITVSNNIWLASRNTMNVHLVDSGKPPGEELTIAGSVVLPLALGPEPAWGAPLPWRLCARVEGRTVEVAAWPLSTPKAGTPWGDATYSGTVEVPEEWVYAGQAGWYAGHLAPGEETRYRDLHTGPHSGMAAGVRLRSLGWLRSVGTFI